MMIPFPPLYKPQLLLPLSHTYSFISSCISRRSVSFNSKMAALGGIRQTEGSQNSLEINDLARFAVDEHNKKQNSLLELKKVTNVKEQVVAGTMYYITMEVADGGQKKAYEAKVWVKPWMNFKEVQEFKLVNDA